MASRCCSKLLQLPRPHHAARSSSMSSSSRSTSPRSLLSMRTVPPVKAKSYPASSAKGGISSHSITNSYSLFVGNQDAVFAQQLRVSLPLANRLRLIQWPVLVMDQQFRVLLGMMDPAEHAFIFYQQDCCRRCLQPVGGHFLYRVQVGFSNSHCESKQISGYLGSLSESDHHCEISCSQRAYIGLLSLKCQPSPPLASVFPLFKGTAGRSHASNSYSTLNSKLFLIPKLLTSFSLFMFLLLLLGFNLFPFHM